MFSEFFYYYNQDNQDENLQKSPKMKARSMHDFQPHRDCVFVFKIQTKSEVELTIKPEIEEGGRPLRAVLGLIP